MRVTNAPSLRPSGPSRGSSGSGAGAIDEYSFILGVDHDASAITSFFYADAAKVTGFNC
jgi:hypothetical protein